MKQEILVNVARWETRAALLENGILQEVYVERPSRRGLVSNIYKGKVSRVLPGMQAAFIEIGLERTAFLHASDIAPPALDENGLEAPRDQQIHELVTEGGEILVQVLKDPLGTKGARLTTYITIPSRFLVYLPKGHGVGVSARIDDETERQRLRELVLDMVAEVGREEGGYILRTAAEGTAAEALRADMLFLRRLWDVLQQQAARVSAGTLVHEDLPLEVRLLRDLLGNDMERVLVDSDPAYERMAGFARMFMPDLASRIERYAGNRLIFDLYGVEDELQRALDRKVQLKSGGYLIIDQTEALTTVDVNTGGYVGGRSFDDTIFKTNLEAAQVIARQLRVRNLGGIIIIDFIDMDTEEHRNAVLNEFRKALARDRTRMTVNGFTQLGLVEMTRKRTRESLAHVLCEPCPVCEGRGELKTAQTVCYQVLRELLREGRQFNAREFRILGSQQVIDMFLDEESQSLAMLSDYIGKPVSLQVESAYNQEQFDIVLM